MIGRPSIISSLRASHCLVYSALVYWVTPAEAQVSNPISPDSDETEADIREKDIRVLFFKKH